MLNNQDFMLKKKFQEVEIENYIKTTLKSALIGIDEVGRGSLSGPLVLGFFSHSLNNNLNLPLYLYKNNTDINKEKVKILSKIKDSKKILEKNRKTILSDFQSLLNDSDEYYYGTIFCSSELIDQFGLGICLQHIVYLITLLNINRFGDDLIVLLDGRLILPKKLLSDLLEKICLENNIPQKILKKEISVNQKFFNIIKGDDKYFSIAAASIIAKVERDDFMINLSAQFPDFQWHKNKGYGTQSHIEAIQQSIKNKNLNNYCRKSFLSRYLIK